jgi:hypothetical protein
VFSSLSQINERVLPIAPVVLKPESPPVPVMVVPENLPKPSATPGGKPKCAQDEIYDEVLLRCIAKLDTKTVSQIIENRMTPKTEQKLAEALKDVTDNKIPLVEPSVAPTIAPLTTEPIVLPQEKTKMKLPVAPDELTRQIRERTMLRKMVQCAVDEYYDSKKKECVKKPMDLLSQIRTQPQLQKVVQCAVDEYYDSKKKECVKKPIDIFSQIQARPALKAMVACERDEYYDVKSEECVKKPKTMDMLTQIRSQPELRKVVQCAVNEYYDNKRKECVRREVEAPVVIAPVLSLSDKDVPPVKEATPETKRRQELLASIVQGVPLKKVEQKQLVKDVREMAVQCREGEDFDQTLQQCVPRIVAQQAAILVKEAVPEYEGEAFVPEATKEERLPSRQSKRSGVSTKSPRFMTEKEKLELQRTMEQSMRIKCGRLTDDKTCDADMDCSWNRRTGSCNRKLATYDKLYSAYTLHQNMLAQK